MHDGQQFGRERACPLQICTKLLLQCWYNWNIWREVLLHEKSPLVIERSYVGTANDFVDWVLVDENENPVGVLLAMN